jgi:hypothetical protein
MTGYLRNNVIDSRSCDSIAAIQKLIKIKTCIKNKQKKKSIFSKPTLGILKINIANQQSLWIMQLK